MAAAQAKLSTMLLPVAMRMMVDAILAALALAGFPANAQTQAPLTEAAKAMVGGNWEFSNADRDKRCTITFKTDAAAAGMKLEFDSGCASLFPFITEIAGWRLAENDFLRMLDAKGNSVLEFSEVESRIYEAPRPGEGILFIQESAAVGPPPKQASQMLGDWALVRGTGKPICILTFADTPAGADLALTLKAGCEAAVTRFAPIAWLMDRGELVIKNAREQTWRFEEGENAIWQRVPETTTPLVLRRP